MTNLFLTNMFLCLVIYVIIGMMTVNVLTTDYKHNFLLEAQMETIRKGTFWVVCFWPLIWLFIIVGFITTLFSIIKNKIKGF